MAALTPTKARVRALEDSKIRQYTSGEALSLGDWVVINTSGNVVKHGGSSGKCIGMVVSLSRKGTTDGVSGDDVGVAIWGPVAGYASLNPGRLVYLGSAGALDSAGTVAMGYNESADVIFIMPLISSAAS